MRALTDAAEAEFERRKRQIVDAFLAGELTLDEAKAARDRAAEELGPPVPERVGRRAIRTHGHLGLRALDVAAGWTLAARRPPAPPRRPHRGTTRSHRPRRVARRCAARGDPDESEPPLGRHQQPRAAA